MIVFQLATVGILAWFAFRERIAAAGVFAVISVIAMLAMGMLASPSTQAKFENRIFMNWIDQSVNVLTQASFLAAAYLVWRRANSGKITGIKRGAAAV